MFIFQRDFAHFSHFRENPTFKETWVFHFIRKMRNAMVYRNLCATYLFLCEECQVTLRRVFETYILSSLMVAALPTHMLLFFEESRFEDVLWKSISYASPRPTTTTKMTAIGFSCYGLFTKTIAFAAFLQCSDTLFMKSHFFILSLPRSVFFWFCLLC